MSDQNLLPISDSFDQDFGQSKDLVPYEQHDLSLMQDVSTLTFHDGGYAGGYDGSADFMDYQDPLKYAYKHQFQPLVIDLGNTHFVKPHYVDGYFRSDGTYVEGYYRDGDGNPAIDRPAELGGGYIRSNPDGNPFNNLK